MIQYFVDAWILNYIFWIRLFQYPIDFDEVKALRTAHNTNLSRIDDHEQRLLNAGI